MNPENTDLQIYGEGEINQIELIPASKELLDKMKVFAEVRKESIKEELLRQERKESSNISLVSASDQLIKRMCALVRVEREDSAKEKICENGE